MYKKAFIIFIAITLVCSIFLAVGCDKDSDVEPSGDITVPSGDSNENINSGENTQDHIHTYSIEWSNDSQYHWRESTCSHDVVSDKDKHSFDEDGMCSICKYYTSYGFLFQLNTDGNAYTVVGLEDCNDVLELVIPSTYCGKPVTDIAKQAFEDLKNLTSVTIPDSITSIGAFAFDGCTGLKGVYISNMTSWCNIDFHSSRSNPLEYAQKLYLNNTLVTTLTIPQDIQFIDSYAFFNCVDLIGIKVDENNAKYKSQDNCVIEKDTNTLVLGCNTSVIPSSVTSIGTSAFEGCSFSNINIPYGVTTIGYDAFKGCDNLTSIELPPSVTSIRDDAFANCSNLANISLPSSLINIGMKAFANCKNLTSVDIPFGTQSIGQGAFMSCTGLTKVAIPSSVLQIGTLAFVNCPTLTIYCEQSSQPSGWEKSWNGTCDVKYDSILAPSIFDNTTPTSF